MFRNPCQHFRTDLFTIMKGENIIRPTRTSKNTMRCTRLSFDHPTNTKKSC